MVTKYGQSIGMRQTRDGPPKFLLLEQPESAPGRAWGSWKKLDVEDAGAMWWTHVHVDTGFLCLILGLNSS